jgi:hypothetical protein
LDVGAELDVAEHAPWRGGVSFGGHKQVSAAQCSHLYSYRDVWLSKLPSGLSCSDNDRGRIRSRTFYRSADDDMAPGERSIQEAHHYNLSNLGQDGSKPVPVLDPSQQEVLVLSGQILCPVCSGRLLCWGDHVS